MFGLSASYLRNSLEEADMENRNMPLIQLKDVVPHEKPSLQPALYCTSSKRKPDSLQGKFYCKEKPMPDSPEYKSSGSDPMDPGNLSQNVKKSVFEPHRYLSKDGATSDVLDEHSCHLSSTRLEEEQYGKAVGNSSRKLDKASSFKKASFSKSLDYVQDFSQVLLELGCVRVSLVKLKSIDPFITREEEALLRSSAANFHRGCLYGSVIDFFLARILENKPFLAARCVQTRGGIEPKLDQWIHCEPQMIFIPANVNYHWVLIVADLKEKNFLFLDPAGRSCSSEYKSLIRKWSNFLSEVFPLPDEYEVICPPHACQHDDVSCGVYICYYVDQLVTFGYGIDREPDVGSFREYIYGTIVGRCFDNDRYTPCSEFEYNRCKICNQKH